MKRRFVKMENAGGHTGEANLCDAGHGGFISDNYKKRPQNEMRKFPAEYWLMVCLLKLLNDLTAGHTVNLKNSCGDDLRMKIRRYYQSIITCNKSREKWLIKQNSLKNDIYLIFLKRIYHAGLKKRPGFAWHC